MIQEETKLDMFKQNPHQFFIIITKCLCQFYPVILVNRVYSKKITRDGHKDLFTKVFIKGLITLMKSLWGLNCRFKEKILNTKMM